MTTNNVEAFVQAILADRPPKQFPAAADDTDVLRVAIELRASRAEFAGPDPQFVEDLHRRLAATAHGSAELLSLPRRGWRRRGRDRATPLPAQRSRPGRMVRPRFGGIGKAAAAVLLVASTFTATNLMGRHAAAPVAQRAAGAAAVRFGALISSDGRPLGRTYAYSGNPSWVFTDVRGMVPNGVYTCVLHLADGSTVTAGLVAVYNGAGDWAHTVKVQASQLRRATLVTSTGVIVANATFT